MKGRLAVLIVLALAAPALAGCIDLGSPLQRSAVSLPANVYDTSRGWSVPLSPALYEILAPVKLMVPSFDGVELSIGLFMPAIEGCDWNATALPEACQIPTVMMGSPYWLDKVGVQSHRPPMTEWLTPRGYATVQMALRGTGESRGCMEYKSLKDIEDVSAVIDWIAAQPWSNGNVGMIGRSYAGTAAWSGAASGNPHLKTIVPISGAVDAPLLYFKNGTAEFRTLIPHAPTYWAPYGLGTDGDALGRAPYWSENLCPEVAEAHVVSGASAITGDASAPYWQERNLRPAILENYRGSVWVIHGLEDWNVNPSQVVPFVNEMQDAGIETHAWLGVWGHAYPDRVDEHRNVRWDWADRVVKWFDHYLKGAGEKPRLGVEVEDTLFVWRHEASYPPRDATWAEWELAPAAKLSPRGEAQGGTDLLLGGGPVPFATGGGFLGNLGGAGDRIDFTSEPLPRAIRVAGLPQLHVGVTPTTPAGGYLFAELYDVYPDGRTMRIGWGAIDLRYAEGGNTEPMTLVPGAPVVAKMEFEPVDALLAEGHRLRLVLHRDGVEDILPSPSMEPVAITLGKERSLLRLPEVARPTIVPSYTPPGL